MRTVLVVFNRVGLPETQLVINVLVLALAGVVLFIVGHTVFDLLLYLAFRFRFRNSFIPHSWLLIVITTLWSMLTPARSQAVGVISSATFSEVETQAKSNQLGQINSLFSCSVVVAGLLLEIGKIRGRQLCKLEAHARLIHPSASAILTEQGLRAVQNSQSESAIEVLLPANSEQPIFVPLGVSNSQLMFVDLGKDSVICITSTTEAEQLAVFNALMISALFAANNKLQIILYSKTLHKSVEFAGISVASSIPEVLSLVEVAKARCVMFSREPLVDHELTQLLESAVAVVCQHSTSRSTTALQSQNSNWQLSPNNVSITPFGLSSSQIAVIGELFADVARCADDASVISRGSNHLESTAVALENVNNWKVLVRTLGPVDVQLADGTVVKFEKSKTKELLAWLTNHRSRPTRSAARTALWEFTVADATFTNVVSDIRRTLNHTRLLSPLEEWIPRTFSDQLLFHQSIISDGEFLQSCIVRAQDLPPEDAVTELRRGLELVRDLPFAGTGYLWPDAEGITSQLVLTVITAASMAAEIDLQRGEIEGVFWATAQGLKVLGAHEELFALRMRAHAFRGDLAGVRFEFDSYQRAISSDSYLASEPSTKLVSLLGKLTAEKAVALAR